MSNQEQKPSYLLFRHYTTDKASNLVEIQNPNGNSTHFKYDSEGRLEVQVDPLDRVISTKESNAQMLVYAYTAHNTIKSLIDPVGNTTEYDLSTLFQTTTLKG